MKTYDEWVKDTKRRLATASNDQASAAARVVKLSNQIENPELHYKNYVKTHEKNQRKKGLPPKNLQVIPRKPPENNPPEIKRDIFGDPAN